MVSNGCNATENKIYKIIKGHEVKHKGNIKFLRNKKDYPKLTQALKK